MLIVHLPEQSEKVALPIVWFIASPKILSELFDSFVIYTISIDKIIKIYLFAEERHSFSTSTNMATLIKLLIHFNYNIYVQFSKNTFLFNLSNIDWKNLFNLNFLSL